ncbi:uncharacterized protein BDZ99DRAFT_381793 [Mytilinidion resinicola]|uniref:Ras-domain-containing protein n=1 Tax=Mytilinidion resinicola TaxID=574789 RepID=A0A6A6YY07_9PEZI|nr:uncharacterized protein BDZ99DRAFT_381793 [Mytilinidion resinicola]KAF2812805.1 hypothetical protein BDZ99DRAFT_381793 [Mytilinidion resinicola]
MTEKRHKLVVLGDGGVGKTALTLRLRFSHFVETYDPTIKDLYLKHAQIDEQVCLLDILDTAGQEEYFALQDQWIRGGEGFLLVYSISSRSSFTRIRDFHCQIQMVKESTISGSPLSAPVMLVANKCDRVLEREISTQEGSALAHELGCGFVETSVKTGVNVDKAFYDVVRQLRLQKQQPDNHESYEGQDDGGSERHPKCGIL